MTKPIRIAIIEDDPGTRALLGFALKNRLSAEYTLDTYEFVKDKELAKLCSGIYDLFLVDLMLLHISGEDIVIALRANKVTKCTPIIILTAKTQESQALYCFKLKVDDFIRKPFSPNEVAARIKNQIERRKECNERKTSKNSSKKS